MHETDPTHQNYMNGFFKAFRVPVRVRYRSVIEECLEAFFSACCEDVKYTQSQEYFAEFAENNEFEFYENDICIRHR